MSDTTVLRTTKIGNGFVKEDVLEYLDELNSKISAIQEENEKLKKGLLNPNDKEVRKYKSQVEKLQVLNEKLYEEKIEMEYRIKYLHSLLEKFKSAEKTPGIILHKMPEETNSDDSSFKKDVMESLGRIENQLLALRIESTSGGKE